MLYCFVEIKVKVKVEVNSWLGSFVQGAVVLHAFASIVTSPRRGKLLFYDVSY